MRFLILLLLISMPIMAQDGPVNFMEIDLKSFEYDKRKVGQKGRLAAREVSLSRADLTFNFQNKDKIFDARLFSDSDSINFKTDFFNFDFKLKKDSDFFDIQDLNISNTLAIINPNFFSAEGEKFELGIDDILLEMNDYFAFCTKNDPDFDMATSKGIETGCLTELSIYPTSETPSIDFKMKVLYDDGDNVDLFSKFETVTLKNSEDLEVNATELLIKMMGFAVKTKDLNLKCRKDSDLFIFDAEKILKDCENTAVVDTERVVVINDEDKTRFFIKPREIRIENGSFLLDSEAIQFVDESKNVTMYDFKTECEKNDEATVYDLHSLIGECVRSGRIDIGKVFDKKDRSLYHSYEKVLNGDLDPLKEFDKKITRNIRGRKRTRVIKDQELQVSDLVLNMNHGNIDIKLTAFKKVLGVEVSREVTINGQLIHDAEEGLLTFKIKHAEVPLVLGFKYGKDFISETLADMIVGDTVTWDKDNTFFFHL